MKCLSIQLQPDKRSSLGKEEVLSLLRTIDLTPQIIANPGDTWKTIGGEGSELYRDSIGVGIVVVVGHAGKPYGG